MANVLANVGALMSLYSQNHLLSFSPLFRYNPQTLEREELPENDRRFAYGIDKVQTK